ncbi:hypothetical protein ACFWZ7_24845 [Nocardiopsis alba]|uniref:hypothetical protein n=1 Tax=Nocardiopsis alba TaxID=53437 RepID=UPI00366ACF02
MKHRTTPTRRSLAVVDDGNLTVYLGSLRGYQPQKATNVSEWMNNYIHPADILTEARYNGRQFWHRGCGLDRDERLLAEFHAAQGQELPKGFAGWWTPDHIAPRGRGYGHIAGEDPHLTLCGMWTPLLGPPSTDGTSGQATCPVCEAAR